MLPMLSLASPDDTRLFAEDIAAVLAPGDVLALKGDLGAGKTTFARAVIRALSDMDDLEVPSPTFTLEQSYETPRGIVHHYDFYRLETEEEAEELGVAAASEDGIVLIEWPDRAPDHADTAALWITLEPVGETGRTVTLDTARPERWRERLTRSRAIRSFLDANAHAGAYRRHLTGDASTRAYERIRNNDARHVLMNAPERPDGPPIRDGLPYSRIAHLAESVRPFVAIAGSLREKGYSAPEILAADIDAGLVLMEDLGDAAVVGPDGPIAERYESAIDLLADMHAGPWPETAHLHDGSTYRLPVYDETAFLIEVELYPDWYVPHVTGSETPPAARAEFLDLWQDAIDRLHDAPLAWVLRDFHSPNLIWMEGRTGVARIGLLDFQDALIGPAAYDVASLCQDARVTVSETLERALVDRYCTLRRSADAGFDREGFGRDYAVMAAQRATKILGIFARLDKRDGKPNYLRHIPRLCAYLERCLAHPALSDIRAWYEDNAPPAAA
ncbi:MAG: tRNA (adenosine(37)-N6)-threonylcarbamoyltransferase complex ATPase subunit type 1 TsaE [Pseudomonadota bacterium]